MEVEEMRMMIEMIEFEFEAEKKDKNVYSRGRGNRYL
jgi:hypothetical protein